MADREPTPVATAPTSSPPLGGDVVHETKPSLDWIAKNLGGLEQTTIAPGGKLFFPERPPRLVSEFPREFRKRFDGAA